MGRIAEGDRLDLSPLKLFKTAQELIDGYHLYYSLNKKEGEKQSDHKVCLVGRAMKSGNVSLYRYGFVNGKRVRNSTGVVLYPETDSVIKNENDAAVRREREAISLLRTNILQGKVVFKSVVRKKKSQTLVDFIKVLADEAGTGAEDSMKASEKPYLESLAQHIANYDEALLLSNVGEAECKDILRYINTEARSRRYTKDPANAPLLSANAKTVMQGIFKMVLDRAVRKHLLVSNPWYLMPKELFAHPEKHNRTFLDKEEVKRLMATPFPALQGKEKRNYPDIKNAFMFGIASGLRYSDIKKLTLKNIYERDGQYFVKFRVTKTLKMQDIPIAHFGVSYLPKGKKQGEPLFTLPDNKDTNTGLKKWAAVAGVDGKHVTFHMSRHTMATLELASGVPIETVSRQLGHASIRTTQIYAEVMAKSLQNGIEKLDNFLNE